MLSGDDALTLPLMAVGGRGVISVASNEVPGEMAQMVEPPSAAISPRAPIHDQLLPLMQVNFVESNPIPVKSAMAAMGLLEEVYRLPMVPPRAERGARRSSASRGIGRRRSAAEAARVDDMAQLQATDRALSPARANATRGGARGVRASCARRCRPGVRAAEPDPSSPTGWRVNAWVKQGILLGFRFGDIVDVSVDHGRWPFFDKDTLPLKKLDARAPASASCPADRRSATARISARGVICMPPMYINIGAYVGDGTLVDSHALVGSCAQIGRRVHLSAAAQIGGVIEPVGALPVIIEDDVLVGGNTGVYEGRVVKRARCSPPARSSPDRRRSTTCRTAASSSRSRASRSSFPRARSSCPARARSPSAPARSGACRSPRRSSSNTATSDRHADGARSMDSR